MDEFLETLSPETLVATMVRCRDAVTISEGYAVYGGQSRSEILAEYEGVRNFLVAKLDNLR